MEADRIVEVIGDFGESAQKRWAYGSGCIVAGRTVLTAAHVVSGAASVIVRDARKQVLSTLWPGQDTAFIGTSAPGGPDLALVELAEPSMNIDALPLARVNRGGDLGEILESCITIGYPWVAENFDDRTEDPAYAIRDTKQVHGEIPILSSRYSGLLSLEVAHPPIPLPPLQHELVDSVWSGMSGAPVLAYGCLIGVVTANAPREGPSAITVTPLTLLEPAAKHPEWGPGVQDPAAWWEKLGVRTSRDLDVLPRPRRKAPYLATVREIRSWTKQLQDREAYLEDLTSFAQGSEGYRLLEGPRYAGKTALLAELVTARLPPRVDVISFFVSRIMSQADSYKFLAAVVPQLAEILDAPVGEADAVQFRSLWQQAARRALQRDRHLLLVVDGLDEDLPPERTLSIAAHLPFTVAGQSAEWERAHVLVSNREESPLPWDLPTEHPLHDLTPQILVPYSKNENYRDLAQQEINGLKALGSDAWKLLGTLAAAGGALSVPDLQHLTGLSDEQVNSLVKTAHRSLQPVGPQESRRYAFADDIRRELQSDQNLAIARYRAAISSWADYWRSRGWRSGQGFHADVPRYLLEVYPDSLSDAPQRRAELVSDAGWIAAAIGQLSVDLVLAELRKCVAGAPGIAGPAAMLAIVRGQAALLRSQPDLETSDIVRQLCLQAMELDEKKAASDLCSRLAPYPGLVPLWSSRRPYRALIAEINAQAGRINAVALARDGRVVVGADDGRVWIWDPSTPSAGSLTLGRHDGPVRALAIHEDGRVVSGGQDKSIRVWDLNRPNARSVELGRHDGAVRALAILDPDHVISGGDDWLVRIWTERGSVGSTKLGRHAGAVRSVAVDPVGLVVSGGDDGRVYLWDPAAPGTAVAKTEAIDGRIMTVAVAPDRSVIAAGTDRVLYRWYHEFSDPQVNADPVTQPDAELAEFGSHHNIVRAVTVLREGPREGLIVSGGDDGRLVLWQAHDRGVECVELGRHDGPIRTVWAQDDRAASGGKDQRVRVWDLGEPNLAVTGSRIPTGPVSALCVCPDGWIVSGGTDKKLWLWEPSRVAEPIELGRHDSAVIAVTALPGTLVMSCGAAGRIHVWDRAAPGELVRALGTHEGAVLCCSAGDGVVSGGYDGRVLRWDIAGDARPVLLGEHSSPVAAVAVLSDGRVATGGTAGDVMIWCPGRPGDKDIELEPIGTRLNALAALPGCLVGGGDDGCIWVWDLDRGRAISVAAHGSSWVTSLASLNGHLISAGTDGRMIVWESESSGLRSSSVVACAVYALASGRASEGADRLAVAHADSGISYWLFSAPPESS